MRVGMIDLQLVALQRSLLAAPQATRARGIMALPADQGQPAALTAPLSPSATSVQMLIAIAAATPEDHRRRLIADADRGLGMLERFHAQQRLGRASVEQVREIAAWARTHSVPDDADAAKLLRDIELRVLVELAKYERAG